MTSLESLKAWIGRRETREDVITPQPLRGLRATLDLPPDDAMGELPPLWHWLYFLPTTRQSELGPDGHPQRGGFLPPVPLPRRMWAGGQFEFVQPLRVGDTLRRTSTIMDVSLKTGRTGRLCFVRVRHDFDAGSGLALREFHDIVYRDLPQGEAAEPAHESVGEGTWRQTVVPDDVLLFRYSALTFNGHRIHYDRRYVTQEEGYPGLIVHGPLMATMLAGLGAAQAAGRTPAKFEFRALKPVFDLAPFQVCGEPDADTGDSLLWIRDSEGHCALRARMAYA